MSTSGADVSEDNGSVGLRVPKGVSCLKCRYNLRGLDCSGVCPECGFSVNPSLSAKGRVTTRVAVVSALTVFVILMSSNVVLVSPRDFAGTNIVFISLFSAKIFMFAWFLFALLCLTLSLLVRRAPGRRTSMLTFAAVSGLIAAGGLLYNVVAWLLGMSAGFA